jgi:hypothetical protein
VAADGLLLTSSVALQRHGGHARAELCRIAWPRVTEPVALRHTSTIWLCEPQTQALLQFALRLAGQSERLLLCRSCGLFVA